MTEALTAKMLSKHFLSFRKSDQIVVYCAADRSFGIFLVAVRIHLRSLAKGKIFEDYRVERLGEWVGRRFPVRSEQLNEFLEKSKEESSTFKAPEVFDFFKKGLINGREMAKIIIKAEEINGSRINFEEISPD